MKINKNILIVSMLIVIMYLNANANNIENIPRSFRTENMQVIQSVDLIPMVITEFNTISPL